MAKGSEQFAWKHYPGQKHECYECGRPLRTQDVASTRKIFPSQKTEFHCVTCSAAQDERLIRETRERLGLRPQA